MSSPGASAEVLMSRIAFIVPVHSTGHYSSLLETSHLVIDTRDAVKGHYFDTFAGLSAR
jgi:hypothetical protein